MNLTKYPLAYNIISQVGRGQSVLAAWPHHNHMTYVEKEGSMFKVTKVSSGVFNVVTHPRYGGHERKVILEAGTKDEAKRAMRAYAEALEATLDEAIRLP